MPMNKNWTEEQRTAYAKAYKAARKTEQGSPKSMFGGGYAHDAGVKAAEKVGKKKRK